MSEESSKVFPSSDNEDDQNEGSDDSEDEKSGFGINAKALTDVDTCLVPENLECEVVTDSDPSRGIKVAPGQGKIPTNFMRQDNFDMMAFPRHHPTGRYGLHSERSTKVSVQNYFVQRVMNKDERFSTDPSYIFMAQQFVERCKLESQISIAGRKGLSRGAGARIVSSREDATSGYTD